MTVKLGDLKSQIYKKKKPTNWYVYNLKSRKFKKKVID